MHRRRPHPGPHSRCGVVATILVRTQGLSSSGGANVPKPRILVVDDERVVVEVLSSLLDDPDREILTADCAARALEHARASEIAVALVDKNLGADSGLALARQLKQVQPELEVILI